MKVGNAVKCLVLAGVVVGAISTLGACALEDGTEDAKRAVGSEVANGQTGGEGSGEQAPSQPTAPAATALKKVPMAPPTLEIQNPEPPPWGCSHPPCTAGPEQGN